MHQRILLDDVPLRRRFAAGRRRQRYNPRLADHFAAPPLAMPSPLPPAAIAAPRVAIASLDQEGRGLTPIEGKAVFVEGALPGEVVTITTLKKKADLRNRACRRGSSRASAARVDQPWCPHFGVCGACMLQHFDAAAQVAAKQRALEDALWHIGRVRAAQILPWRFTGRHRGLPASGPALGAPRSEKGRRAGRLPRTQIELRRRYDLMRGPAARRSPRCCRSLGHSSPHSRCVTGCRRSNLRSGTRRRQTVARSDPPHTRRSTRSCCDSCAALHPADEDRLRAFRRSSTACSSTCRPAGPGDRRAIPPGRTASGVRAAGVRPHVSLLADRVHAGQPGDQPRAGSPRHRAPRSADTGERVADFFCGHRQLHAADRPARRRRRRHRGERTRSSAAREENAALERARRSAPRFASRTCSRRPPKASRRWGRSTRC